MDFCNVKLHTSRARSQTFESEYASILHPINRAKKKNMSKAQTLQEGKKTCRLQVTFDVRKVILNIRKTKPDQSKKKEKWHFCIWVYKKKRTLSPKITDFRTSCGLLGWNYWSICGRLKSWFIFRCNQYEQNNNVEQHIHSLNFDFAIPHNLSRFFLVRKIINCHNATSIYV